MKKVLVIDDARAIREEIVDILIFQKYEVFESCDALTGLQAAKNIKPDLIICDISQSEINGFSLLSEMKSEPLLTKIPFILVTEKLKVGKTESVSGFEKVNLIYKPFQTEELLSLIYNYLEKGKGNFEKKDLFSEQNPKNKVFYKLPNYILSPLTSILGFTELFEDSYPSTLSEINDIAKNVTNSTLLLKRNLENILTFVQLEIISSKYKMFNHLNSGFVLNPGQIISLTSRKISSCLGRNKDLVMSLSDAEVNISSENLEKIINELVDNAFRYSVSNTPVYINAISHNEFYIIDILNRTTGINSEVLEKLFSENYYINLFQEQNECKLGLIIAKRLVELHGGKFLIKNMNDNQTKISVKLKCNIQNKGLLELKEKYTVGVTI